MVIPLPMGLFSQVGPPTEFGLRMRFWFIVLLTVMTFVTCSRLFVLLDIVPGFFFGILVGMGIFAVHSSMDMQILAFFGITCLFCGVMDLLHLVDFIVRVRYKSQQPVPFFSEDYPTIVNFGNAIRIAVPITQLVGAMMTWVVWKDYRDSAASEDVGYQAFAPGDAGERGYGAAGGRPPPRESNAGQTSENFQAFSGQGQRLGAG